MNQKEQDNLIVVIAIALIFVGGIYQKVFTDGEFFIAAMIFLLTWIFIKK